MQCFYITFLIYVYWRLFVIRIAKRYSHLLTYIHIVKWKKHIFCKLLKYLSHDTIFSGYDERALFKVFALIILNNETFQTNKHHEVPSLWCSVYNIVGPCVCGDKISLSILVKSISIELLWKLNNKCSII